MSDLARLLQQYGYGEQPNALAQDGVTYDTSNVLAGMPKKNALADALRIAMNAVPENKENALSMLNMVRGGLGTAASWLDYQNKPQPSDYKPSEMLAPLGAGFMGSMFAPQSALGSMGGKLPPQRPSQIAAIRSMVGDERGGGMAGRRLSPSDYNAILEAQRATEGFRAAVRDPETGKVYIGGTHRAAIDSVPPSDTTGAWGRLHGEWDRSTDNSGFIDRTGRFVTRTEAEKMYGVSTIEDLRDLRSGKPRW